MSWKELDWVVEHSPYRGERYLVHVMLAELSNDIHGHELWLTQATLARKCHLSRYAINRTLALMEQEGFLERISDGGKGAGSTVRYRFLMPISVPQVDTSDPDKCQLGEQISVNLEQESFFPNREHKGPSQRRHKSTSVPESFALGERVYAWKVIQEAQSLGCDLERERDRFLDWHRAKGNTMADWDAAFRTWIGNYVAREKAQHKTVEVEVNPNSFGRIY